MFGKATFDPPTIVDLRRMKPRHTIALLSVLLSPTLFAQEEPAVIPTPITVEEPAPEPNEAFTIVEEMPEYPGGQEAMMKYIASHITYPREAIKNEIEGAVFIQFVVERDGSIAEARVLRGIGGGCDEEALRVVNSMPNWKPGKQRGKLVRTRYNLPIRFKLASDGK